MEGYPYSGYWIDRTCAKWDFRLVPELSQPDLAHVRHGATYATEHVFESQLVSTATIEAFESPSNAGDSMINSSKPLQNTNTRLCILPARQPEKPVTNQSYLRSSKAGGT